MRKTAGLLVIHRGLILLVQQFYDRDRVHLSIPKGSIIDGEDSIDTAIREGWEETGISIPKCFIDTTPHIVHIKNEYIKRYLIYYVVNIPDTYELEPIKVLDKNEVLWAGWVEFHKALSSIQETQLPLLIHLNENYIHPKILNYLVAGGYIAKIKHPTIDIYLYNYTDKCKKEQFWNEVTLWCRGLILNSNNVILYRPFKKFFEYSQLYSEFIPKTCISNIYEKKDGFLGIMYWSNNCPYIATRDSFISFPAVKANIILYTKYALFFDNLNPEYTYLFEIVFPNNYLVIDYGLIEDLYLIGIYDNSRNKEVHLQEVQTPFLKVRTFDIKQPLSELLSRNIPGEEGYVLLYSDGTRIKIKFRDFKRQYLVKHEKKHC